jgi:hypothetical protein
LPVWAIVVALLAGVALSAVVYHQQVYRPAIRVAEGYLGIVLDDLFDSLATKHRELVSGGYELRINLMRVRPGLPIRPMHVRIEFWSGAYTDAELEQEYRIGVGNAGTALQRREQTVYDSIVAHEPRLGMTATQREITAHVNSILSTPVFRPGEFGHGTPIAILNLDSSDHVTVTNFRRTSKW